MYQNANCSPKALTFSDRYVINTVFPKKLESHQGSKETLALGKMPCIVIRKEAHNASSKETNSPIRGGISNWLLGPVEAGSPHPWTSEHSSLLSMHLTLLSYALPMTMLIVGRVLEISRGSLSNLSVDSFDLCGIGLGWREYRSCVKRKTHEGAG